MIHRLEGSLSKGIQGKNIKLFQDKLTRLGFPIPSNEMAAEIFLEATEEAVKQFQTDNGLEDNGVVDEVTAALIDCKVEALMSQQALEQPLGNYLVMGKIRLNSGELVPDNTKVSLYGQGSDHPLAEKTLKTSENGYYAIPYTIENINQSTNLHVKVFDASNQELDSRVINNAQRVEIVNIGREPSEYKQYREKIAPLLQLQSAEDLELRDLKKTESVQHIVYLHNQAGISRQHIAYLIHASKLAHHIGSDNYTQILFGLFRQGLPTNHLELLSLPQEQLREALYKSADENIIALQALENKVLETFFNKLNLFDCENDCAQVFELEKSIQDNPEIKVSELENKVSKSDSIQKCLLEKARSVPKFKKINSLDETYDRGKPLGRQRAFMSFVKSALADTANNNLDIALRKKLEKEPLQTLDQLLTESKGATALYQNLQEKAQLQFEILEQVDDVNEILLPDLPLKDHPLMQAELQRAKLYHLAELVTLNHLSEDELSGVIKRSPSISSLNDTTLSTLVEEGSLQPLQAKELGIAASLYRLVDEEFALVDTIKQNILIKPEQTVSSQLKQLINLDWGKTLIASKINPPTGLTYTAYAKLLRKRIETLYPTDSLIANLTLNLASLPNQLQGPLEQLQPLFQLNADVLGSDSFSSLRLEIIDKADKQALQESFEQVQKFANTYPGLQIPALLNDTGLDSETKISRVMERINLIPQFRQQNPNVDVFNVDYAPDSVDLENLDFNGFAPKDQEMVLDNLKAYQRIYTVTQDIELTQQLASAGFHSAWDMADQSRTAFLTKTGLEPRTGDRIYDTAQTIVGNTTAAMGAIYDVMNGGFDLLPRVDNITHSAKDYLKKIKGFKELFGEQNYCKCKNCQSILSPTAYFVDLMSFVEEQIIDIQFTGNKALHPLNLKVRRLDLWKLPLSCENTHTLIPYLELINEVLENYIAARSDISIDITDRNRVQAQVYKSALYNESAVQATEASFQQPFLLPLAELDTYLAHFKKPSRHDIAKLLLPADEPAITRAALKLSKRDYDLIIHSNSDKEAFLARLYDSRAPRDPAKDPQDTSRRIDFFPKYRDGYINPFDAQLLLKPMGLKRKELGALIKTKFVKPRTPLLGSSQSTKQIEIIGEKRDRDKSLQKDIERIHGLNLDVLDRMHRFVRLWSKLPWSIQELDLVLYYLDFEVNKSFTQNLDAKILSRINTVLSIQKRFDLSVEHACALFGNIPHEAIHDGQSSLFDRLFNLREFVLLGGQYPQASADFQHPIVAAVTAPATPAAAPSTGNPSQETQQQLHRLLAGLQTTDDNLYQLIEQLAQSMNWSDKVFKLSQPNISLLYHHIRTAELLQLKLSELFQLIDLAGLNPKHLANLNDLENLLKFYDWWQTTDYSLSELATITLSTTAQAQPSGQPSPPTGVSPAPLTQKANTIANAIVKDLQTSNALSFTDTVFAFEGVTESESNAIITDALNTPNKTDSLIEVAKTSDPSGNTTQPVIQDTLYQLGTGFSYRAIDAFDIPATIFASETQLSPDLKKRLTALRADLKKRIKELLLKYHASEIIPNTIAKQLNLSVPVTKHLMELANIDLEDNALTKELQTQEALPQLPKLVEILSKVIPLSILFKDSAFSPKSIKFIAHNSALFEIGTSPDQITVSTIQKVERYRQWVIELNSNAADNEDNQSNLDALHSLLISPTNTNQQISNIAQVLQVGTGVAISLQQLAVRLAAQQSSPWPSNAIESLEKLHHCTEILDQLGTSSEALELIISDTYDELAQGSKAILSAFRAKYSDETKWEEKIEPFRDKINTLKRDALADFLINPTKVFLATYKDDDIIFESVNDLYHYFLIDVELGSCARTSRIVSANSSLQLYVHRVIMNLEQNREGNVLARFKDEDAYSEWSWRKNYQVWKANRRVFLYPENYLEPSLRDNKSPLFESLEAELLQQQINANTVQYAYSKYMKGFEEVANLKIAGSYHDVDWDKRKDILHLFGVTTSNPPTFYYRKAENVFHGASINSRKTLWFPWEKIEVQITSKEVSPIVFRGRLYLFWVEIFTQSHSDKSDFIGYKHTFSIKFTSLSVDNTWVTPQKISFKDLEYLSSRNISFTERGDAISIELSSHTEPQDGYTLTDFSNTRFFLDKVISSYGVTDRSLVATGFAGRINIKIDLLSLKAQDLDASDTHIMRGKIKDILAHSRQLRRDFQKKSLNLIKPHEQSSSHLPIAPHTLSYIVFSLLKQEKLTGSGHLRHWIRPDQHKNKLADLSEQDQLLPVTSRDTIFLNDAFIESDTDTFLLHNPGLLVDKNYEIQRIGTTLSETISKQLFSGGFEALLSIKMQASILKEPEPSIRLTNLVKKHSNLTKLNTHKPIFEGPYAVYYREIYFQIPFLIANYLNSQQKFAEAQRWYHYIFNPTAKSSDNGAQANPKRSWQYIEFREQTVETFREQLSGKTVNAAAAIAAYRKDPFNPHAIARLRSTAYQKTVVMKYIDNLLDWGDHLFAQDRMESINEATLLYVLASDILGERPAELGNCVDSDTPAKTYEEVKSRKVSEFLYGFENVNRSQLKSSGELVNDYSLSFNLSYLTAAENLNLYSFQPFEETSLEPETVSSFNQNGLFEGVTWKQNLIGSRNIHDLGVSNEIQGASSHTKSIAKQIANPIFCVPENKELRDYWQRVEDQLHKIRNCMNISGVRRQISLFSPELDPRILVRAKASGLSLEDVLNSVHGNLPPYRFAYLIEKAKEYTGVLQGFGSALLSALERKDIEELTLITSKHQQNTLQMTTRMLNLEIKASQHSRDALLERKKNIQNAKEHYNKLIEEDLNDPESSQMSLINTSYGIDHMASPLYILATMLGAIPRRVGTTVSTGTEEATVVTRFFAESARTKSGLMQRQSSTAGIRGGQDRREQGWKFSKQQSESELLEIDKQIEAAEIRIQIAEDSLKIHQEEIEQTQDIYEFYKDRFSNFGLYTWFSNSLQRLYRTAYNSAYSMAKLAEQAYRFERNDDTSELIGTNHWEASRAGLLAGERLLIDLQNLERRFLETDYRNLEIDQSFSLTQINPAALIALKQTGECTFTIPEIYFDLFYPGHYRRKIKSARLSIPCITGPYTNVSATLTLQSSKIRIKPDPAPDNLKTVPSSRSVSIATSNAQNDAGVFELSFRDERYMPFEGAGAVESEWQITLPKNFRQFDYQSINDVILHISYTAEQDGSFREKVEGQTAEAESAIKTFLTRQSMQRVFSLRQEFSQAFHQLLHSRKEQPVKLALKYKHFPIFLQGKRIAVSKAHLILNTATHVLKHGGIGEIEISVKNQEKKELLQEFLPEAKFGDVPTATLKSLSSVTILKPDKDNHEVVLTVKKPGNLSPTSPAPSDPSALDSEKLLDAFLYLEYKLG